MTQDKTATTGVSGYWNENMISGQMEVFGPCTSFRRLVLLYIKPVFVEAKADYVNKDAKVSGHVPSQAIK